MNDIQNIVSNLSKLYAKHLEENNPQVEFWVKVTDKKRKHKTPKGLDGRISYTDAVKWINQKKEKYQSWTRFTFLDSNTHNIFISFIIEEGEVQDPFFVFESIKLK
jgi:aspartyl/asparaginyl-tRNA synthetase